jgi:hypothetical protein
MVRATVLTMTDAERKKKEYLELLGKTPARAVRLEGLSREIIQAARLAEDVATPMGEVIANLPADQLSPEQWDQLTAGQRKWLENASRLEVSMAEPSRIFAAGSAVMSSTSTSAAFTIQVYGLPQAAKIQTAQKELSRVLEQAPLVESARASMRRLGLDRRNGERKSARELLDEAKTALDQPSGVAGGEVAVLLTLREAIEAALAELIRRQFKSPRQTTGRRFAQSAATVPCQLCKINLKSWQLTDPRSLARCRESSRRPFLGRS